MSLQLSLPLDGNTKNIGLTLSNVVVNGTTVNNEGKIGQTYLFDGVDDFISIGNVGQFFKGGSNPFSISFWFYHSGNNRRGVLFGNYGLLSTNRFNIEIKADNTLRFWWDGSPDWTISAFTIPTQTWIHCTIVYTGSKVLFYKNGTQVDQKTITLSTKNPTGLYYIGRDSRTGGTAFNGKMNEFKIWDHALSLKEINEIYDNENLICHYTFNDSLINTKNKLFSCFRNDYPITCHGTINSNVYNNGRYKYCASFSGSQYLTGDDIFKISPKAFSFWLYISSIPKTNQVVFVDGKSHLGFGFYNNGAQIIPSGTGLSTYCSVINNKIIPNQWNFIVVQDPSTPNVQVWVNGEELSRATNTNLWTHNNSYLYIGARNNGTPSTFGIFSIQDFRGYSELLSADKIYKIYHNPVNFDNTGNLFCSEIEEDISVKVHRFGIFNASSFKEDILYNKQISIYNDGMIKTNNQIIEK